MRTVWLESGTWMLANSAGTMYDMVRCGEVRFGAVRYGTVRCGAVRYGAVW